MRAPSAAVAAVGLLALLLLFLLMLLLAPVAFARDLDPGPRSSAPAVSGYSNPAAAARRWIFRA